MRALIAPAIIALLTHPAYSQQQIKPSINLLRETEQNPAVLQQRKEIEEAYRSTVNKIPDQKSKSNDPWQNVRSDPAKKKSN